MTMASVLAGYGARIELFYKILISKGFFTGGATTGGFESVVADRTTYATETTANVIGANLPSADTIGYSFGYGNLFVAFYMGGFNSFKTTYSTETTAAANYLGYYRWPGAAGTNNFGYIAGGTGGQSAPLSNITKQSYATEAVSGLSATLSLARRGLSAAGNADNAFYIGGQSADGIWNYYTTADKFTFATESCAAAPSANFVYTARTWTAATGNVDKGIFSGGFTQVNGSPSNAFSYAVAERVTYATDTLAYISGANLTVARHQLAAAGDINKGFFSGGVNSQGTNPNLGILATADKTTFSTETTSAVSGANLTVARLNLGAA